MHVHQLPFGTCFTGLLAISVMLLLTLVQSATASTLLEEVDNTKMLNMSSLDRLRMKLFTNYDKHVYPNYHGEPTNITVNMFINHIDINELNSKITLYAWLRMHWYDDSRMWNKSDYEKIWCVNVKPREVWKPDVMLFNSAGAGSDYLSDWQISLFYEGSVLWVPPVVYTSFCNLNLRMWPYDNQTCTLRIGFRTVTQIDSANLTVGKLDYSDQMKSSEWQIVESKTNMSGKDYYNYVDYTFKLQRRSDMYAAVIFTPAICIILMALSIFWVPPLMSEKLVLNGILIVVIAMFLMYFAQLLPILAKNTPLIVLFYSSSLLLLSISTVIAVIVLYFATAKRRSRMPDFLKSLLNGPFGTVLLLTNFTLDAEQQPLLNNGTKELSENLYSNPDLNDPSGSGSSIMHATHSMQSDWTLLATAVDRICFLCYCVIFITLATLYSV